MNLSKLRGRVINLSDMPVVAEFRGKKYEVRTAKKFRNQTRKSDNWYFGIVLGKEIKRI